MFRNYLTIAFRHLIGHKLYSFINIGGMAIGMASCALILLYVQHELSYDTFHARSDRTYRVLKAHRADDGEWIFQPGLSGPFAGAMSEDFPEVETTARLGNFAETSWWVKYEGKVHLVQTGRRPYLADPEFLDVFDFTLLKGDRKTALQEPYSMVLTDATAQVLFGSEDPMGKRLTIDQQSSMHGEFTVTGVIRLPENTYMQFAALVSSKTPIAYDYVRRLWEEWRPLNTGGRIHTFVVLREGTDVKAIEAALPDFVERHMGREMRDRFTYVLEPLTRLYLHTAIDYPGFSWDPLRPFYGDVQSIHIASAIAVLIVLIACVNFMNLATARSVRRAKEVGLRKVSGAHRFQLMGQFLGEAVLLSGLAFVLAAGLVELALPRFEASLGKDVSSGLPFIYLLFIPFLVLLVGLLAGSYPAFFLSAFEPVSVLKGNLSAGLKGVLLKKGLVVFQFAISILLIVGSITIYRQLNYIQNRDLGFNKEYLIQTSIFWRDRHRKRVAGEPYLRSRYQTVKQAFLAHPNVLQATAYLRWIQDQSGGISRQLKMEDGRSYQVQSFDIDEDFLSTFDIDLIEGKTFSGNTSGNGQKGYILNETAVRLLGLKDPVGQYISELSGRGKGDPILGVVRDFHIQSLHEEIRPLVMTNRISSFTSLAVKVRGENLPETIAFLEQTWKQFLPELPLEYWFVDEIFNAMYREDQKVGQLVGTFTLLAILVACLGLFGLAAFTAEQRTKEIGVRKALGASVSSIVLLLSKEFVRLVLIANLIAWPVSYLMAEDWLQNFAYRVDIVWWVFASAGVISLLIALGTVAYQALRAARVHPVKALRYE